MGNSSQIAAAANTTPFSTSPYIVKIQEKYNVQVMFRTRPKLHATLVVVKGCEWEVSKVKEATVLLIHHMCENLAVSKCLLFIFRAEQLTCIAKFIASSCFGFRDTILSIFILELSTFSCRAKSKYRCRWRSLLSITALSWANKVTI